MTDNNLLLAAIVVFTMLVIGLVLTVLEFTKIQRDSEAKKAARNKQNQLR
ncbi:MAG: hypothetical protein H7242_18975 [Microbacteriaceae bacterium]|nr:hypothetical protein [Burkholderiaceae bacterium]